MQWDQRGAGKTFGANNHRLDEPLTLDRMQADAEELIIHLLDRYAGVFRTKRTILWSASLFRAACRRWTVAAFSICQKTRAWPPTALSPRLSPFEVIAS
ncbi:hypothetical protein [Streptomyces malaysiensis]|uniref:Uncharacterized protein n=1 Tax=Streptomyces malaysiensis subsp. samsunensis TaxID=459658 RepID=A0A9X2RVC7_STRMQ|nr:hypothetical protein [Streptomyces samsunensis]MCQ8830070.1 hypothetical protein [Streptomyces samsunensis]